jgi:hypothetical protein
MFTNKDMQLTCIISDESGKTFCIRDRKRLKEASQLIEKVTNKCTDLVNYVVQTHPDDPRVKQLKRNYDPAKISETLPTSALTAFSESKSSMHFCLNKSKNDDEDLIDEHTLTFVAIHEMSHLCTAEHQHTNSFWRNFKFLLTEAKAANIHEPADYGKRSTEYCGLTIKDNPYYDM